ncbi:BrnA antitoxin family protein [Microcoleus sp. N9_B2]|uniref:BrnA antitoxin family protein n=1 Tax=unclassified Microcoleus TaxID=2642155 RepID=UPI002FD0932E
MSRNDLNITSGTNWAALESRSEENIDYSDIPPLTDEFFERSTLRIPAALADNLVQLDPDIKQWFEAQGEQYKTLINNVLRQYIENNKTQHNLISTLRCNGRRAKSFYLRSHRSNF